MVAHVRTAGERTDELATIRCIEAGLIPEGTLALYAIDPIARARRMLGVVCVVFVTALAAQAVLQLPPRVVFGLAIALGLLGVRLSPTIGAADEGPRRPAVLVTATAILKRESGGFRVWLFAELVCAQLSGVRGTDGPGPRRRRRQPRLHRMRRARVRSPARRSRGEPPAARDAVAPKAARPARRTAARRARRRSKWVRAPRAPRETGRASRRR